MKNSSRSIARKLSNACLALGLASVLTGISVTTPVFAAEKSSKKPAVTQKAEALVNLNRASAEELMTLNGIGASKAKAIIDYRKTLGKFSRVDQLTEVKGIGKATVDKNRARLRI